MNVPSFYTKFETSKSAINKELKGLDKTFMTSAADLEQDSREGQGLMNGRHNFISTRGRTIKTAQIIRNLNPKKRHDGSVYIAFYTLEHILSGIIC